MGCCGRSPRTGVLLDGTHVEVGAWACSWACFRRQLGVPLGIGAAIETTMGRSLILDPNENRSDAFGSLWDFVDGQRYYSVSPEEAERYTWEVDAITPVIEPDEDEERAPWEQDPDAWRG